MTSEIDRYCNLIVKALHDEELTMLDLARYAARFRTIAQHFQNSLDRLQEDWEEICNQEENLIKKEDKTT